MRAPGGLRPARTTQSKPSASTSQAGPRRMRLILGSVGRWQPRLCLFHGLRHGLCLGFGHAGSLHLRCFSLLHPKNEGSHAATVGTAFADFLYVTGCRVVGRKVPSYRAFRSGHRLGLTVLNAGRSVVQSERSAVADRPVEVGRRRSVCVDGSWSRLLPAPTHPTPFTDQS